MNKEEKEAKELRRLAFEEFAAWFVAEYGAAPDMARYEVLCEEIEELKFRLSAADMELKCLHGLTLQWAAALRAWTRQTQPSGISG